MFFNTIIDFAKNNATLFIGLLTISIGLLSTIISLIEYFREKSYYDYFFIEDFQRQKTRSGLHPEFIALSISLLCSFVILIEIAYPIIHSLPIYVQLLSISLLVPIISMISSGCTFWFYHYAQKHCMKCWDKTELFKVCIKKGLFNYLKWITICITVSVFTLIYKATNIIPICFLTAVLCVYIYIRFDYESQKRIFPYAIKHFSCVMIENELYVILASNDRQHYCVRCEENDDNHILYLDQVKILLVSETKDICRLYINGFSRVLNGNILSIDNNNTT